MSKKKSIIIGIIITIILVIFDQYTKQLAVNYLKGNDGIVIINNVFKLRYLENTGAAFSMLENKMSFFLIITPIMLIFIGIAYFRIPMTARMRYLRWICVALAAGAIGNMIDRAVLNYVVDFFYFELINFPTFNVADIYITVSMVILIILILFYYKDNELDEILGKKHKNDKN